MGKYRPCVSGPAEGGEPGASPPADAGRHGDGLHVGHGRRAAEDAHVGREGRLEARLALLALQRLDEGRLLAADVGAGAAVDEDVKVVAAAASVLPQKALVVSLSTKSGVFNLFIFKHSNLRT